MRFGFALLATVLILAASGGRPTAGLAAASPEELVLSAQQPTPQAEIDVDVNRDRGAWWASPMWIAIGAIAAVLVIVVIAMAARGGGGTTVIKD